MHNEDFSNNTHDTASMLMLTAAEKYFLKATKNQNILGYYNLGVLYWKSKFKHRSETTAIKWMLKAAQQDY